MFNQRSKVLFAGGILGTAYTVYLISYFGGAIFGSSSGAEAVGAGLATALVTPHMIGCLVATILLWFGFFFRKGGLALASSILYIVAGVLFIPYIMFSLPIFIVTLIGYIKQKNLVLSV